MLHNGQHAEITAILNSGREEIDKFLVISAMENRNSIKKIEDEIKTTKAIKRWLILLNTSIIAGVAVELFHTFFK